METQMTTAQMETQKSVEETAKSKEGKLVNVIMSEKGTFGPKVLMYAGKIDYSYIFIGEIHEEVDGSITAIGRRVEECPVTHNYHPIEYDGENTFRILAVEGRHNYGTIDLTHLSKEKLQNLLTLWRQRDINH